MTNNERPQLLEHLLLDRCPHCSVASPTLERTLEAQTRNFQGQNLRYWKIYRCTRCGGLITAGSNISSGGFTTEMYPAHIEADGSIPPKARDFLNQAMDSLQNPAGAVMLAASAVDEMLKEKDYKKGKLYTRINQATKDNLITKDMGRWAHQVRLDANEQRHSDEDAKMPTKDDAKKSVEFATALAEFIFVLPSKVSQGLKESTPEKEASSDIVSP